MKRILSEVLQEDENSTAERPEDEALAEALSESFLPIMGLFESQVAPRVWEVTVIESGWSLNGRYWPAELLRESVGMLDGCSVARYRSGKHLPPEYRTDETGPIDNVLGVTANPWVEELANGKIRVKALFHCADDGLNKKLEVAQAAVGGGQVPNVGLSIDARGPQAPGVAEGRRGLIVQAIRSILETTVVAKPAANGRVDRMVAGLDDDEEGNMKFKKLMAFLLSRQAQKMRPVGEVQALQEADVVARTASELQEMLGANAILSMALQLLAGNKLEEAGELLQGLLDTLPKPAPASPVSAPALAAVGASVNPEVVGAVTPASVEAPVAQEAIAATSRVRDLELKVALLQSGLPEAAQESIRKQFTGRDFTETDLQEAIDDRRRLTSTPARSNGVVQATPSISIGRSPQDALQARLDLCLGYDPAADRQLQESQPELADLYREIQRRPRLQRIRGIFQDYMDDPECSFRGFGANSILHEALSTDFPTALNNALNKAFLQQFEGEGPEDWERFIHIDPDVDNYKDHTYVLRGGFGNLGDVPESDTTDTFQMLATPSERSNSFSVAGRGGKFVLTKHMVKNDEMGVFRNIAQDLAQGARHVRRRFAWGLLIGRTSAGINTALSNDNAVIYSTAHGNYSTTALAVAAIAAGRQQLRLQRRWGTRTTITEAVAANNETSLTFATTRGFFPDTVLQIGSELMRVVSVTSSTVAVVERGYMGTTAAASHADNSVVTEVIDTMPPKEIGIIVPTTKETALFTALNTAGAVASNNNDASIIHDDFKSGRLMPIVVDPMYLGGNLFAWYMAVPARYQKHTVMGYMDNRQTPEVLLQDQATVGKTFDRNNYTYRIEWEFGGCNVNWQGLQGNIATS